jgi:ElaB/YqjD/DUF883 family membrane-anchored ribosome-binding protein
MDQQLNEAVVSDATTKVEDTVSSLTATTEKTVQDKIDQAKPVLQELRENAGAAIGKTADLARKVATAGVQAVDAIHGAARDVGNQASQAATNVYQQGARASGSVSRYASEQPLTALLVAGAIGYGLAYLIRRP